MITAIDPRYLALEVLCRVDQGAYADLALDAALSRLPGLDPRDRALATELVYGTLRCRGRLDFALARNCKQGLHKIEYRLLQILRLGAYQLLQLERIPASAAVHTSVELARYSGLERATGFVNGVLRALDREQGQLPWPAADSDPLGHLVHALSLPRWLAERWLASYGAAEAIALGSAMLRPAPVSLRVNTLATSRDQLLSALTAVGHVAAPSAYAPDGIILQERAAVPLPGQDEGWFQQQDEASMLIAHLLAPQPDERLLDACSAPGGKTTHLAALAENRAQILALDLHPRRLQMVTQGASRLGCQGIATRAWDLTTPPTFLEPGSFDRILLDAPCSGLGVLRRNPEIRWRRQPDDSLDLAARQRRILEHLGSLLRPGGVLLYSVCTEAPAETTEVVADFLARRPDFAREDLRPLFPAWEEIFDAEGALRTLPHRHHGMDAFFAVRLRRRA